MESHIQTITTYLICDIMIKPPSFVRSVHKESCFNRASAGTSITTHSIEIITFKDSYVSAISTPFCASVLRRRRSSCTYISRLYSAVMITAIPIFSVVIITLPESIVLTISTDFIAFRWSGKVTTMTLKPYFNSTCSATSISIKQTCIS